MRSAIRLRRSITSLERATQIVAALANAVEAKDVGLVHHCRWLAHHAARVGVQVGLRGEELEAVAYGALLHDVGKIGVPEHLLRKEGPAQRRGVDAHAPPPRDRRADLPAAAARRARSRRSSATTTSASTARAIRTACAASSIPLGARIVAVADAYEAMVHGRPYQPAQSHTLAADELLRLRGASSIPTWCRSSSTSWSAILPACRRSLRCPRSPSLSPSSPPAPESRAGPLKHAFIRYGLRLLHPLLSARPTGRPREPAEGYALPPELQPSELGRPVAARRLLARAAAAVHLRPARGGHEPSAGATG